MTRNALLVGELKARRQALGWPVQAVSERCAIEEGLLRDWESGIGSPRLDAVEAWAAALGMRLALVSGESAIRSGLYIDWERRRITIDGSPVRLTPMEWKALERLAAAPGELVSHQAMFHHLYGDERPYSPRTTAIRVLITKLRRLLPLRIEAQWGRGYIVDGIPASKPAAGPGTTAERAAAAATPPIAECGGSLPFPAPRSSAPRSSASLLPALAVGRSELATRRPQAAIHIATQRSEELRVIERFLAERGATRCPDVTTSEQSPLVWDKVKRKWVRPEFDPQRHAMGS